MDEIIKIAEKATSDVDVNNENTPSTSNNSTFKDAMNSFKAKRLKLDGQSNNIRLAARQGKQNT